MPSTQVENQRCRTTSSQTVGLQASSRDGQEDRRTNDLHSRCSETSLSSADRRPGEDTADIIFIFITSHIALKAVLLSTHSVSNDFPCAMTTSSPVVRQGSASAMMSPSAVRDLTINKPNEPPFQLKVEPSKIVSFRAKDLTQQTNIVKLELTNTTQCRQVFKFKVTSNSMFRVSPPLGFLDAGATLSVKLSAMCQFVPPNNRHFFTILHVKSDPNVDKEKSARQVWSPEVKPDGVCRLQASFEKEDGTPHGPLGAALTPMLPCSSASTMGNPK
ncbi:hypothetical protein QR680_011743 [Steinernema hermaphroditum]|uniref:Major sperm protein n=1 Tax=Steinernema hermaphroditum TaxID=289476 RepID=A0AA39HZK1_9BILA|nr:hypothetical protein QR680_011743 [Steinernema hermaphroditum]